MVSLKLRLLPILGLLARLELTHSFMLRNARHASSFVLRNQFQASLLTPFPVKFALVNAPMLSTRMFSSVGIEGSATVGSAKPSHVTDFLFDDAPISASTKKALKEKMNIKYFQYTHGLYITLI